ncbi:MAG: SAF domain-containing protein [Kiloniellales bacterium]|nr:SAF domain-containing protein [Kiloniellales bacterium]
MNLHRMLGTRAEAGQPVKVGLIGLGKFGTMYAAQVPTTPGVHLVAIADLDPVKAKSSLDRAGWPQERYCARSIEDAVDTGKTFVGEEALSLISSDQIEVVIEATGFPPTGITHALAAIEAGKDIVMVTVEADVLAGPILAEKAAAAGVVYSLAYGDQPAEICELVDWARTCGFPVVCAGRGVKYLPRYHQSTPKTVWEDWGLTPEQVAGGGLNPKMFNSFHDGSKPAIECGAVANACALSAPSEGLLFPPSGIDDLPTVLRPKSDGGVLEAKGMVETVSSLNRDGSPVENDIRAGVLVVVEAPSAYAARCFGEYLARTDDSGRYTALYRPVHLIGLELGLTVASVALRREPTGCPQGFFADVVAIAKKDMKAGDLLDGEGGYTVYGRLIPAKRSVAEGALPLGLAHGVSLTRDIREGETIRWLDVAYDSDDIAVQVRKELESAASLAL